MTTGKIKVMLELRFSRDVAAQAFEAQAQPLAGMDTAKMPKIAGVEFDESFAPTVMPGRVLRPQAESVYEPSAYDLKVEPEASTYVVRAEVDEKKIDAIMANENVVGVFSDPVIEPCIVCPGSPPVGTDADVENLLRTAAMRACGMDGLGILIAIVDTGINMDYLRAHGKNPSFDAARSWVPRPGLTPGNLPVLHGTMCAYDVCIAAPKCTLLDIAVLLSAAGGPTTMSGVLSDAVRAYSHLIGVMMAPRRPGELRSMVVNNSWGMFHPTWDFPPSDPRNYSDNPNHPFNRIVADLERAGADILFAAGNCGKNCPDGRCQGITDNAIYGANSHPSVLCVAGVDTTKARVGYSTIGPGCLTRSKPDISGYTHFRGSGVYPADGGTSAATPVVSGVVAAVRSKRPYSPGNPATHPAAIRTLVTSTAEDLGAAGYDFEYGYGVVNGGALQRRFCPPLPFCRRFPWHPACRNLCRRFPWLCRKPPLPRKPPIPPIPPGPPPDRLPPRLPETPAEGWELTTAEALGEITEEMWRAELGADPIEAAYLMGYQDGLNAKSNPGSEGGGGGGCCSGGMKNI